MTLLVLALGLSFFACDMLKEVEEALKAPTVSVPQAATLSNFTGTPSTDQNTNLALLEGLMAKVSTDIDSGPAVSLGTKQLKQKSVNEVFVDETYTNEVVVPGITANGKAYAKMSGTMDWESEDYEPTAGDYLQIDVDFDLTLTAANYPVNNVYIDSSSYNFTLNGTFDNTLKLTDKVTLASNGIKLYFKIQYGFGYALSISNSNPNGPGGKFILTASYAKEDSATITEENEETFDYEGFFTPDEITGGKLTVYNNANQKVAEFALTVEELERIIPEALSPAIWFEEL